MADPESKDPQTRPVSTKCDVTSMECDSLDVPLLTSPVCGEVSLQDLIETEFANRMCSTSGFCNDSSNLPGSMPRDSSDETAPLSMTSITRCSSSSSVSSSSLSKCQGGDCSPGTIKTPVDSEESQVLDIQDGHIGCFPAEESQEVGIQSGDIACATSVHLAGEALTEQQVREEIIREETNSADPEVVQQTSVTLDEDKHLEESLSQATSSGARLPLDEEGAIGNITMEETATPEIEDAVSEEEGHKQRMTSSLPEDSSTDHEGDEQLGIRQAPEGPKIKKKKAEDGKEKRLKKKKKKSDSEKENSRIVLNRQTSDLSTSSSEAETAETRSPRSSKSRPVPVPQTNGHANGRTRTESCSSQDDDELGHVSLRDIRTSYLNKANLKAESTPEKTISTGISITTLRNSYATPKSEDKESADTRVETGVSIESLKSVYASPSPTPSPIPNKEEPVVSVSLSRLKETYCEEATKVNRTPDVANHRLTVSTGVSIKDLRTSFSQSDITEKKIHVRSFDSAKVVKKFNQKAEENSTDCRSCGKQVFQMEKIKAEKAIWHKNCFRCKECNKQLTTETYSSHEGQLYCKQHFKQLFQPKVVLEEEAPVRPRKLEMIIRESQPEELPPDVVRSTNKPDYGLEDLQSLSVKEKFATFEKGSEEPDLARSPSQVSVKRSGSILSKMARFQRGSNGDIGVAVDELNGGGEHLEMTSSSEEEDEATTDPDVVRSHRQKKERPMSFSGMGDMKSRWEERSLSRKEELAQERKEELNKLRSMICGGKQARAAYEHALTETETAPKPGDTEIDNLPKGGMKAKYESALLETKTVTNKETLEVSKDLAHNLKEKFEKGEVLKEEDETDRRMEEEMIVFKEAGTARGARSLFKEMDARAPKAEFSAVPVQRNASFADKKSHESGESPDREIYRDPTIVRGDDPVDEEIHSDTTRRMLSVFRDMESNRQEEERRPDVRSDVKTNAREVLSMFRQMEENVGREETRDGPRPLKCFTPPPEYTEETDSEDEEYDDEDDDDEDQESEASERQPKIARASDKIEDEYLSQNAARAQSLRAKFERWEETVERQNHFNLLDEDEAKPSLDITKNIRAKFEAMKENIAEEKPKLRVNRFVQQSPAPDLCSACAKPVYVMEKTEVAGKLLHKHCFRCSHCKCILRMDTYTMNGGKLFCTPHFKQLFIAKGNYDEGFGIQQHKQRWSTHLSADTRDGAQQCDSGNFDDTNTNLLADHRTDGSDDDSGVEKDGQNHLVSAVGGEEQESEDQ